MKRNFYHNRRRLKLEQLESRQMLAGDVTVNVVGGDLSIVGDSENNFLVLTATGNAGEYVVTGTNTTVNGGAVPVTVSGVTGDVTIQLHDGSDGIEFDSDPIAFQFLGDVAIDMGSNVETLLGLNYITATGTNNFSVAGSLTVSGYQLHGALFDNAVIANDFIATLSGDLGEVHLDGGSIGGDVTITATGENKDVRISTTVGGDVRIDLDGLGDRISLRGDPGSPLHIGGSLVVDLDTDTLDVIGNFAVANQAVILGDFVATGSVGSLSFFSATVAGHLLATLSGESGVSSGILTDGNGVQLPTPFSQVGGNMVVTLSSGNGSVGLNCFNVANDFVVRGGDGVEDVRLNNVRAGNSLLIDTGGGNDIVWVHNSSADGEAAILAGSGSDYVLVGNFLGAHSLFIDTAAGFDLVNVSYASFGENLYVWLGGDSDQATVYAASAHYLSVDAGSGYDTVAIQYSAADHLFAGLGDGNDSLAVIGSLARASAFFDGGAGYDLLSLRGNLLTGLGRQNFEAIGP
jgi:hypothetical protein